MKTDKISTQNKSLALKLILEVFNTNFKTDLKKELWDMLVSATSNLESKNLPIGALAFLKFYKNICLLIDGIMKDKYEDYRDIKGSDIIEHGEVFFKNQKIETVEGILWDMIFNAMSDDNMFISKSEKRTDQMHTYKTLIILTKAINIMVL